MVWQKDIDSRHSTSQLDCRSGRHHCNLDHLHIHPLTRPPIEVAVDRAVTTTTACDEVAQKILRMSKCHKNIVS